MASSRSANVRSRQSRFALSVKVDDRRYHHNVTEPKRNRQLAARDRAGAGSQWCGCNEFMGPPPLRS